MSSTKIAMLVGYAVLAALGIFYSGSAVGVWSVGILGVLALAHLLEMAVFYSRCKQAGGSMPLHLANVFLFGIVHIRELKQPD
jgi:uncharacterized protein YhhL (DUF1145 family)